MSEHPRPPIPSQGLASTIDHTALKPEVTSADISKLCEEAMAYAFASVCVNPCWVPLASECLADSAVAVCTVIGFPLGATLTSVKAYEAAEAIAAGAQEVDMVLNIGWLKEGRYDEVQQDITAVVEATRRTIAATGREPRPVLVKVILETALLTDDEKRQACLLARSAGADFVKTSTGFSTAGATRADVVLMREVVGWEMGVKAAGGIRTVADAQAMVEAGATRLGTSAGVQIMQDAAQDTVDSEGSGGSD